MEQRLTPGRIAGLATIAAIALTFAIPSLDHPRTHLLVQDHEPTFPADGRTHVVAHFFTHPHETIKLSELTLTGERNDSMTFELEVDGGALLMTRAPVTSQSRNVIAWRHWPADIKISFTPDQAPSTATPGLPDWMPLHDHEDRLAFTRWFTTLADRTASATPSALPAEITDCAALLRFCYREALRRHDDRWYATAPELERLNTPSIAQWVYPETPLRTGLFRTRNGTFAPQDLNDSTFAQFADAKTLAADNTFRVSRNLQDAQPGDVLFYRLLVLDSHHQQQYHSMIVTGEHAQWAVYHTGPINSTNGMPGKGEIRRVLLRDLLAHPDPRWRPLETNANFLGVYRWNILAEGQQRREQGPSGP